MAPDRKALVSLVLLLLFTWSRNFRTLLLFCHYKQCCIHLAFNIKLYVFFQTYRDIFKNIGSANYVTILLAVACITSLYCTSRFINQNPKLKPKMFMPVPIELIVVSYVKICISDFPLTALGSNPIRDFGFFYEEAIQLAYWMSVDLLRCLLMPE